MAGLTVVIPTLNEASRLPLLLADLAHWPDSLQLLVVDGGSQDNTCRVAVLAGACVLSPQDAMPSSEPQFPLAAPSSASTGFCGQVCVNNYHAIYIRYISTIIVAEKLLARDQQSDLLL